MFAYLDMFTNFAMFANFDMSTNFLMLANLLMFNALTDELLKQQQTNSRDGKPKRGRPPGSTKSRAIREPRAGADGGVPECSAETVGGHSGCSTSNDRTDSGKGKCETCGRKKSGRKIGSKCDKYQKKAKVAEETGHTAGTTEQEATKKGEKFFDAVEFGAGGTTSVITYTSIGTDGDSRAADCRATTND